MRENTFEKFKLLQYWGIIYFTSASFHCIHYTLS